MMMSYKNKTFLFDIHDPRRANGHAKRGDIGVCINPYHYTPVQHGELLTVLIEGLVLLGVLPHHRDLAFLVGLRGLVCEDKLLFNVICAYISSAPITIDSSAVSPSPFDDAVTLHNTRLTPTHPSKHAMDPQSHDGRKRSAVRGGARAPTAPSTPDAHLDTHDTHDTYDNHDVAAHSQHAVTMPPLAAMPAASLLSAITATPVPARPGTTPHDDVDSDGPPSPIFFAASSAS